MRLLLYNLYEVKRNLTYIERAIAARAAAMRPAVTPSPPPSRDPALLRDRDGKPLEYVSIPTAAQWANRTKDHISKMTRGDAPKIRKKGRVVLVADLKKYFPEK